MLNRKAKFFSLFFDFLVGGFFGIWLWGGVSWNHQVYLSHGADPRRAAILLAALGYGFFPQLRSRSWILKGSLKLGQLLLQSGVRWATYSAFVTFCMSLTGLQTQALQVTLYDVGIFHQILWSIGHGLGFYSSISGAGNFLQDHLSPSLALLSPFFSLSGGAPFSLPMAHALLLYLGAGAWIWLAERLPETSPQIRNQAAAATTVFVMGFNSLWGNLKWGFHENVIGFVCISWALAILIAGIKRAKPMAWTLLLIAAGSKEMLLLEVGIIFLIWASFEVQRNRRRLGLNSSFLLVCALSCFLIFIGFERSYHPPDKNYFARYYSYLGLNLSEFFSHLVQNPFIVFQTVGLPAIFKYFWGVFSPWLFLPWVFLISAFAKKLGWNSISSRTKVLQFACLAAIVPSFLSSVLSSFSPLRNLSYHYALELWPILAVFTIFILVRRQSIPLLWIWAVLTLFRMDFDPLAAAREWNHDRVRLAPVREALKQIPEQASVTADELAGPWVANRKNVMRWPETWLLPEQCPDYLILRFAEPGSEIEVKARQIASVCQGKLTRSFVQDEWSIFKKE